MFHSTRNHEKSVDSLSAIHQGLASDGGLLVDDTLFHAAALPLEKLGALSYQEIALMVLKAVFTDIPHDELAACVRAAYGAQWSTPLITPVRALGEDSVLELFHGPTAAFKDVALQILPQFMRLPQTHGVSERTLVVTATSGDTGKAALDGFARAGGAGLGIDVFYPDGMVSDMQRLQMVTQQGANARVYGVKGNFDDAQRAVKQALANSALRAALLDEASTQLSSANSINVGRLMPQIAYYVAAYQQLLAAGTLQRGDMVEFIVPTGNFGDVLAGYYAKLLGLPIAHLVVASNRNRVLFDFLTTGTYNAQREFYHTSAPSMDILISSNLERMLYYMADGDTRLITMLMNDLREWGAFEVPPTLLKRLRSLLGCSWADEQQVAKAIHNCWQQHHYLIDPHTACGYAALEHMPREQDVHRVLLSTANPYKFPQAVTAALGLRGAQDDDTAGQENSFALMRRLEDATGVKAPQVLTDLEHQAVRFDEVIEQQAIGEMIERDALRLGAQ